MTAPGPGLFDLPLEVLRRRRSVKWTRHCGDVLPAFVAEMDVAVAEPVRRVLREAVDRDDFGYADPGRLPSAFAGFAARRYGWQVDPGTVALVPDVVVGIAEVLRLVTRPGDAVVINPPVYPPFWSVVREVERTVVEVPLVRGGDGRGALDLVGLEAAFAAGARVHLLCNPHNPTGDTWSRDTLTEVARLARRYGVTVLADEIHAPMTLPGAGPHTPYASLARDLAEDTVVLASASKTWNLAGLKCALVVAGTPAMAERLAAMPEEVPYRAGHLGVLASVAAFEEGEPWLDALLASLDGNRALLGELLAEHLPGVAWTPHRASCLAWLDCRGLGLGDDPAAAFLERGRVALSPGPTFGREGAGFARLNSATSPALLTEAVRRMARAVTA